jgi:hypothetical protein
VDAALEAVSSIHKAVAVAGAPPAPSSDMDMDMDTAPPPPQRDPATKEKPAGDPASPFNAALLDVGARIALGTATAADGAAMAIDKDDNELPAFTGV